MNQNIVVGIIVAAAWVLLMLRVYHRIKSAGKGGGCDCGCCDSSSSCGSKDKDSCGSADKKSEKE